VRGRAVLAAVSLPGLAISSFLSRAGKDIRCGRGVAIGLPFSGLIATEMVLSQNVEDRADASSRQGWCPYRSRWTTVPIGLRALRP